MRWSARIGPAAVRLIAALRVTGDGPCVVRTSRAKPSTPGRGPGDAGVRDGALTAIATRRSRACPPNPVRVAATVAPVSPQRDHNIP